MGTEEHSEFLYNKIMHLATTLSRDDLFNLSTTIEKLHAHISTLVILKIAKDCEIPAKESLEVCKKSFCENLDENVINNCLLNNIPFDEDLNKEIREEILKENKK